MSVKLALASIRTDGGTQPRATIDPGVVAEYAEAMVEGAEFPPVVVFYDGTDYWLADGFHRVAAYDKEQFYEVVADVKQGSRRDAVKYSLGVNSAHGLRRTNEDKRRAVERALADEEWRKLSDRAIAEMCAVSNDFVSRLRHEVSSDDTSEKRRGLDGKEYPAHQTPRAHKSASWTNPDPIPEGRPEYRRPEPEPEYEAADGNEEEEFDIDAFTSDPKEAFGLTKRYIDGRMAIMPDLISRHEYINQIIRYCRDVSAEMNREAI